MAAKRASTAKKAGTKKAGAKKAGTKKTAGKKADTKKSATKKKTVPRTSPPTGGERLAGVGSDAVRNATGKGWDEWLAILDEAGARAMEHPAIAKLLNEAHRVPGWWAQMVTVGYEQSRGLREKYETAAGFEAGRSKTIAAPADAVFAAWNDARRRARWLADPGITVRTATPGKSLRITWVDGTHVDVGLVPKGEDRTQVQVQHRKLANARAVEGMKTYWGKQ